MNALSHFGHDADFRVSIAVARHQEDVLVASGIQCQRDGHSRENNRVVQRNQSESCHTAKDMRRGQIVKSTKNSATVAAVYEAVNELEVNPLSLWERTPRSASPIGRSINKGAAGEDHKSMQIVRPSPCPLPAGEGESARNSITPS